MYHKSKQDDVRAHSTEISSGCASVTFFSKFEESLPKFNRVGDIIRIQRANVGQYRNYKTFCANLDYGSTWAIFSGSSKLDSMASKEENSA